MNQPTMTFSPLANEFASQLDAARRGSRSAQETLFERYYLQVERIVHAQLRKGLGRRRLCLASRFSTADVVQDVFHSLLPNLGAFRGTTEREFVAYVVKVVRNRTLDTIRHHAASCRDYRRSVERVDEVPSDVLVSPASELAARSEAELLHDLRAALDTFPEPVRRLLRARIERGLGFEALAHELGYPSRYAARRAFFAAQARLIVRLKPRVEGAVIH